MAVPYDGNNSPNQHTFIKNYGDRLEAVKKRLFQEYDGRSVTIRVLSGFGHQTCKRGKGGARHLPRQVELGKEENP